MHSTYLSNEDKDCQKIDQEMPTGDVEPGDTLAIHNESTPGCILANEADVEVHEKLKGVQGSCNIHGPAETDMMFDGVKILRKVEDIRLCNEYSLLTFY